MESTLIRKQGPAAARFGFRRDAMRQAPPYLGGRNDRQECGASTALGDLGWLSRVNSPLLRYLGWATFGVMTAAAVGMVHTS